MRLLPFEDLKPKKGIPYSRAHIWRLERAGKFPKHLRLGAGGRNAWVEDEIDAYVAQKIAERDSEAA